MLAIYYNMAPVTHRIEGNLKCKVKAASHCGINQLLLRTLEKQRISKSKIDI
jgi:hypothetical protein